MTAEDLMNPTSSTAFQGYGYNNAGSDPPISTPIANFAEFFSGNTTPGSDKWKELQNEKNQQDYNSAEQAKQRAYDAYMDNTKYQRTAEDLKKAGLNPLLMAEGKGVTATNTATSGSASASKASLPAKKSHGFAQDFSSLAMTAFTLAKLMLMIP